jgi:hypothetical protein
MASRGHGWFDDAKLLPSERLIRSGTVRLRIPGPPYWWEGELILTTDRLFFLPYVEHPRLGATAFWLHEVAATVAAGRNRFATRTAEQKATFQLIGPGRGPAGLIGDQAKPWLAAIALAQPAARPSAECTRPARRRAAG